jgi:Beta-lactamase
VLRSRGLRPVADRPVPALGAGEVYSTAADLTRYVTALLHGGGAGWGRVLEPTTTASMFRPHFRADPRLPGMGLGFLLGQEGDRRTVGHDGIVPGFLSEMLIAPDDGVGVVVLGNTGGLDGRGAPEPLGVALVRRLLGLPDEAVRRDVPAHPETWHELCGWYGPDPGPVTNLFTRAFLGAGAEVTVRDGHLMLKPLTPVPAVRRGMRLHPDDPDDPRVFRVDLSGLGKGTQRVVFGGGPGTGTPMRLLMDAMALRKRPDLGNPRPWTVGVLAAGGVALAARGVRACWERLRP